MAALNASTPSLDSSCKRSRTDTTTPFWEKKPKVPPPNGAFQPRSCDPLEVADAVLTESKQMPSADLYIPTTMRSSMIHPAGVTFACIPPELVSTVSQASSAEAVSYSPQNEDPEADDLSVCDQWLIITPRFHAVLCSTDAKLAHFVQRACHLIPFSTLDNLSSFLRSFQPDPVHVDDNGKTHVGIDEDMQRAINEGMRISTTCIFPHIRKAFRTDDEAFRVAKRVVSALQEVKSSNADEDLRDLLNLYPSVHNISLARRLRQYQRSRADCELLAHEVVRLNAILTRKLAGDCSTTPSPEGECTDQETDEYEEDATDDEASQSF